MALRPDMIGSCSFVIKISELKEKIHPKGCVFESQKSVGNELISGSNLCYQTCCFDLFVSVFL